MFPKHLAVQLLHIHILLELADILRQRLTLINLSVSLSQSQILSVTLDPLQDPLKDLRGLRLNCTGCILRIRPEV